jgi:hypothetical protein
MARSKAAFVSFAPMSPLHARQLHPIGAIPAKSLPPYLARPFPRSLFVAALVGLASVGDLWYQGVIRVGVSQQGRYGEKDLHDMESREDVESRGGYGEHDLQGRGRRTT